jgi:hypothetical protein
LIEGTTKSSQFYKGPSFSGSFVSVATSGPNKGSITTLIPQPTNEVAGGFLLQWHCVGQRPKRPQVDPLRAGLNRSDLSNRLSSPHDARGFTGSGALNELTQARLGFDKIYVPHGMFRTIY